MAEMEKDKLEKTYKVLGNIAKLYNDIVFYLDTFADIASEYYGFTDEERDEVVDLLFKASSIFRHAVARIRHERKEIRKRLHGK